ncbi:MAG: hypothetical protein K8J09_23265, partial [Planctomycetes bacterium]|nr:hypothetical protein [Planctomycetota bacterium]
HPVASSAYGLPFLWKSIRLDEITGLLQMRNRYYSTELGRFLTRDPLGEWGDDMNWGNGNSYVMCCPLSFGDPTGMSGERTQDPQPAIVKTFDVKIDGVSYRVEMYEDALPGDVMRNEKKPSDDRGTTTVPIPNVSGTAWIGKGVIRISLRQSKFMLRVTQLHEYYHALWGGCWMRCKKAGGTNAQCKAKCACYNDHTKADMFAISCMLL